MVIWQNDCIRNSINQTADTLYGHTQMNKKNTEEIKQILKDRKYDEIGIISVIRLASS